MTRDQLVQHRALRRASSVASQWLSGRAGRSFVQATREHTRPLWKFRAAFPSLHFSYLPILASDPRTIGYRVSRCRSTPDHDRDRRQADPDIPIAGNTDPDRRQYRSRSPAIPTPDPDRDRRQADPDRRQYRSRSPAITDRSHVAAPRSPLASTRSSRPRSCTRSIRPPTSPSLCTPPIAARRFCPRTSPRRSSRARNAHHAAAVTTGRGEDLPSVASTANT
jgi:hypothetical protein